jgi:hypothetical protein
LFSSTRSFIRFSAASFSSFLTELRIFFCNTFTSSKFFLTRSMLATTDSSNVEKKSTVDALWGRFYETFSGETYR